MAEKEKTPSFEDALKQLEEAVERLEEGNLPLADALDLFETGLEASNVCRSQLETARQRVEVLVQKSEGQFDLENLDTMDES